MNRRKIPSIDKVKYVLNSTKSVYIKGDSIDINFKLQNFSNEKLYILKWYTPLEGSIKGKIFRVLCQGEEIPYDGPMVKRNQPSKTDYIIIEPGKSVSSSVNLAQSYQIPECKECTVLFKGRIYDYTTDGDIIPKKAENHQMVNIRGNKITFSVIKEL